ncbi:MAG: NAD(P)H-binding protein [Gammaproteobacteria bacterium]|nr:NAD(P)H-binding protein [Gammaproteobacteria bacterium]
MKPLSVGIVGCGWLGKALYKTLSDKHYDVIATYQRPESGEQLQQLGFNIEQLSLPFTNDTPERFDCLDQDVIIIAIPPRLRHNTDYPDKIKQLVTTCEKHKVRHVILISSTAIYNGLEGVVDEDSELNQGGDKVQYLQQAEQHLSNFSRQSSVIRLAGLLGPERHPSRFIKAGKAVDNGNNPVNLIHQEDAVGNLIAIINRTYQPNEKVPAPKIYNGVSNCHCNKKTFYQAAAATKGLELPTFSEVQNQEARRVSSDKSRNKLGYNYQHDDLLAWLSS